MIETLMQYETAGDPMTGLKWTRKTAQKLTNELKALGVKEVNRTSVGRLLKEIGYSLKVNHKKKALGAKKTPEARAHRNQQFEYINAVRRQFVEEGNPTISADTKKKEMVGNFKNNGASWRKKAFEVSDHDFRQYAEGIAIRVCATEMFSTLAARIISYRICGRSRGSKKLRVSKRG